MEPKEKRTRMLMIRFNTAESTELDWAAEKVGLPLGSWLRSLGLKEAAKMREKSEKKQD